MPRPGFGVKLTEHERDVLAVYRDECGSYEKMIEKHDLPVSVVTCCRALRGRPMDPVKTIQPLKHLYEWLLEEDPHIIKRTHEVVKMRPGPGERQVGRQHPVNIQTEPDYRTMMIRGMVGMGYSKRDAEREADRILSRPATQVLRGGFVSKY